MPKVAVIIPVYNCAEYICQAIDSVLTQTFRDFELIVVDDGSTDNTKELLMQYGNQLKYIYQENKDMTAARNTGIRSSDSEYIAFLDSDDAWLPNKLECQVRLLDRAPEVGLVYCWHYYIDSGGKRCEFYNNAIGRSHESGSDLFEKLIKGNVMCGGGSTPVIRRKCLEKSGMFDESIPYSGDWDLWLRISIDHTIAVIPEPLALYRILDENHGYPEKFVKRELYKGFFKVVDKVSHLLAERGYRGHRKLRRKGFVSFHLHCAEMWQSLDNRNRMVRHLMRAMWSDWHALSNPRIRKGLKTGLSGLRSKIKILGQRISNSKRS